MIEWAERRATTKVIIYLQPNLTKVQMENIKLINSEDLGERMRASVSLCWEMFSRKVGNKLISINKEASMQLQYAYLLKQLTSLITLHENERFEPGNVIPV